MDANQQVTVASLPISAIITAYQRIDQTLETIRRIESCRPSPDEVLVHVDGNETDCADAVRAVFPHLAVMVSESSVGPGGGRNKLVAAAANELVASFDDDSYPLDVHYFARIADVANVCPNAAVYVASVYHRGEAQPSLDGAPVAVSSFVSGGAVFRKSAYLEAGGFVPLPVAYGMEEEDLALRLLDRGQSIMKCPSLRVFHDTDLGHHSSASITSGVISNLALLVALRYPPRYWPYGVGQVANRVLWSVRNKRLAGVVSGLARIPMHLWRHRHQRKLVSSRAMELRKALRGSGSRVTAPGDLSNEINGNTAMSVHGSPGWWQKRKTRCHGARPRGWW